MAIEDRELAAGTILVAKHKGEMHECKVGKTTEGTLTFSVNGETFKSPSSAGHAITRVSCNGWAFWTPKELYSPRERKVKSAEGNAGNSSSGAAGTTASAAKGTGARSSAAKTTGGKDGAAKSGSSATAGTSGKRKPPAVPV